MKRDNQDSEGSLGFLSRRRSVKGESQTSEGSSGFLGHRRSVRGDNSPNSPGSEGSWKSAPSAPSLLVDRAGHSTSTTSHSPPMSISMTASSAQISSMAEEEPEDGLSVPFAGLDL